NFDELLHLDWVRNASSVLNPALTDHFELALDGEPVIDGKPAWVISFSQKNPTPAGSQDYHATAFKGEITIFADDYTVKEIKVSARSKRHNRQGKFLAVGSNNSNYYEDVAYTFTVTYSKLKPEMMIMDKTYTYKGDRITESSELLIKNVQVQDVKEIVRRDYFAE
ncbi:MAG: hypothetical protein ACOC0R_00260, partial [Mariniphaga sp.]